MSFFDNFEEEANIDKTNLGEEDQITSSDEEA